MIVILHRQRMRHDVVQQGIISAEDIDRWHRARGFCNGIGYHYVIRRDGSIENGRPLEMTGAHCKDHNRHSIGICYEGGLDSSGKPADTRTPKQKETLRKLLTLLHKRFPKSIIVGHTSSTRRELVRAFMPYVSTIETGNIETTSCSYHCCYRSSHSHSACHSRNDHTRSRNGGSRSGARHRCR